MDMAFSATEVIKSCCNLYGILFSKTSGDGVSNCKTVTEDVRLRT